MRRQTETLAYNLFFCCRDVFFWSKTLLCALRGRVREPCGPVNGRKVGRLFVENELKSTRTGRALVFPTPCQGLMSTQNTLRNNLPLHPDQEDYPYLQPSGGAEFCSDERHSRYRSKCHHCHPPLPRNPPTSGPKEAFENHRVITS